MSSNIDIVSHLVWDNDLRSLKEFLNNFRNNHPDADYIKSLDEWDQRGNTPLHLALMLGRTEAVEMLLNAGASCNSINADTSDALDEAIGLGDRDILAQVLQNCVNEDVSSLTCPNGPWDKLVRFLPKGYFEFDIKLKSVIPGVAKLCPKDTVKIWLTRDSLRIDWGISKICGMTVVRGNMSVIGRLETNVLVSAVILNHDTKSFEKMVPRPSKGVVHDMVDSCLRYGVIRDKIPIKKFTWSKVTSQFGSKTKTKVMKRSQYATEVYKLDNLSWLQKIREPVFEKVEYEKCSDNCRTSGLGNYIKTQEEICDPKVHKVESLEALQFISEPDIKAEDYDEEYNIQTEEVGNSLKEKLVKLTKHARHKSVSSTMALYPTQPQSDERPVAILQKTHVKSCGVLPDTHLLCKEAYFSCSDGTFKPASIGREAIERTIEYSRKRPIFLYMCKDLPFSIKDVMPILEWLTRRAIPTGVLAKFIEENKIEGFPVRVEVPIVSALSLKITLTKFEQDFNVKEDHFSVPKNYTESDILPLIKDP